MAIVVRKVLSGSTGKWSVEVLHGDMPLVVTLQAENARALVGKYVFVELDVEHIAKWEKTREPSGIFAISHGRHRLVGEIHDETEIATGIFLYDLYIEVGPDYYAIDSGDIGGARLKSGDRIALDVVGLSFAIQRE